MVGVGSAIIMLALQLTATAKRLIGGGFSRGGEAQSASLMAVLVGTMLCLAGQAWWLLANVILIGAGVIGVLVPMMVGAALFVPNDVRTITRIRRWQDAPAGVLGADIMSAFREWRLGPFSVRSRRDRTDIVRGGPRQILLALIVMAWVLWLHLAMIPTWYLRVPKRPGTVLILAVGVSIAVGSVAVLKRFRSRRVTA